MHALCRLIACTLAWAACMALMAQDVWTKSIRDVTPMPGSDVKGRVSIRFIAPGMTHAQAYLWAAPSRRNPSRWGHDVALSREEIRLDAEGRGSFSFAARRFPSGPLNVRICTTNRAEGLRDEYELQLYNLSGKDWSVGIPDTVPAAARGMRLLLADDFDGPLSISNDGSGARYCAHKPRFGDFSGWPFTDVDDRLSPFRQRDSYLKIQARKPEGTKGSTGLIASVGMDGEGLWFHAPCYLECRLLAHSAPGTWPAFWTLNQMDQAPGDELDIIEAYGGHGPGNPGNRGYFCTAHFWLQKDSLGRDLRGPEQRVEMTQLGGRSSWSTTFHTYGLYIGREVTVYYLDDLPVFAHPTNDYSRRLPHFFLINYAIGGSSGWPVDLERYRQSSDMYVDYVRVFQGE